MHQTDIKKLRKFLDKFEGRSNPSHHVIRRLAHTLMFDFPDTMMPYHTIQTINCVELVIPEDRIDELCSLYDEEEVNRRRYHPSVRKAWEHYRVILAMARKY